MTTPCVVCTSPTADGYACVDETRKAAGQLAEIAELTPAARAIAYGQSRTGSSGGSNTKPGPRTELNLAAGARMDAVQNALTTRAREIAEERGHTLARTITDPVIAAAWYLADQLEWARHRDRDEIAALLSEIDQCARVIRGLVRGPRESKYLGPCGYEHATEVATGVTRIDPCPGDVYGIRGATKARCRLCGAEVAQADRVAWLDGEVRCHAFTARDIADAYRLNVKTIRSWASRGLSTGLLRSYWRTDAGIVADWAEPPEGEHRERLHYVGDVLDLAAADAVRRAEGQAKRARRREQATAQNPAA